MCDLTVGKEKDLKLNLLKLPLEQAGRHRRKKMTWRGALLLSPKIKHKYFIGLVKFNSSNNYNYEVTITLSVLQLCLRHVTH